ncbi:MAG: flagellar hook-associated protein FlgL [Magnetococcales bacterium]|nr:flagellar hook-associated protein FlgL [Magnetococcales bacterium]
MRVTQNMMYRSSANALQDKYGKMHEIQEATLSGRRLNKPSDDPSSAFRDIVFSSNLSQVKSMQRTMDMASERLTMAETHIDIIHEKLVDAETLAVKFANSTVNGDPEVMTAASREALTMYEEAFKYATESLDGIPLFGGGRTKTPFDVNNPTIGSILKRPQEPFGSDLSAQTDMSMQANSLSTTGTGYPGVPASVRVTYNATAGDYTVNVNGTDTGTVTPANNELDMGWVKMDIANTPTDQDAFYFEVFPDYQGGTADRAIKIGDGRQLPGNVTGEELIEGLEPRGRNINIFEELSGLRGAMLRADSDEVAARIDGLQEGRAQASDMQVITGIRTAQVESIQTTLGYDQATLETAKAKNGEVDLFAMISKLEQTNQALQVMTISERTVLDNSILDFIR